MANMTVGTIQGARTTGRRTRLRSVTFTHTAAGTAAGSATTTFKITGTLLRVVTTGGDAAWNIILSDDAAQIWASPSITATATSYPLYQVAAGSLTVVTDDESDFAYGIPLVNSTLTCATSNVSTTAPTVKVIWEEDDATYTDG
jgi:hypothetical protein